MGKELTARHLLERSRMKNCIHAMNGTVNGTPVSDIPNVVSDPIITQLVSERVLFFFVTREYADLLNVVIKQVSQHGFSKRPSTASDQNPIGFFALLIGHHSFLKSVELQCRKQQGGNEDFMPTLGKSSSTSSPSASIFS